MDSGQVTRLDALSMLVWVVSVGLAAGVIGVYPTWVLHGGPGLAAEAGAGLVVMAVMLASGGLIIRKASRGPGTAAFTLAMLGMLRAVASVLLTGAACWIASLPVVATFVWAGIFYLSMLAGESIWLARALKRDAFRVALGQAPSREARPSDGEGANERSED